MKEKQIGWGLIWASRGRKYKDFYKDFDDVRADYLYLSEEAKENVDYVTFCEVYKKGLKKVWKEKYQIV